jgi:hypothetical protein
VTERIIVAHLVREETGRLCNAPYAPGTADFTPKAWAAHTRLARSGAVIRCGRCDEVLQDELGLLPSAERAMRFAS